MHIGKNHIISLDYIIYDEHNEVIDKTADAPLRYLHGGYDDIFRKVEKALAGKSVNESIDLHLNPEDAFGNIDPELIQSEPLAKIQQDVGKSNAVVGMVLEASSPDSAEILIYRITAIADNTVILDANPPLAGQKIRFTATVTGIDPASPEQIAAGTADLT